MTALICLPTSYIAGKMMVVRAIMGQLNLITFPPSSHPLKLINTIIDFAAFTPMQIMNEIKMASPELKYLKKIIIGGGKVNALLDEMLQSQNFEAYETYGMTETLSHIALRRINGKNKQKAFMPLNNIKLLTDNRGCLTINIPDITKDFIISNDIAEILSDGSFIIKGRADNIINSGGIKISPEDLEEKIHHLLPMPFIFSSIKNENLGQQLVLVIEKETDFSAGLLIKIKNILPKHQAPKHIYVLNNFPRTTSGKIKRKQIESELETSNPIYTL